MPIHTTKPDVNLVVKCLWFACASSAQTYLRTEKSRESYEIHFWRVFSGKLGEYAFVDKLFQKKWIDETEFKEYERGALSIYYGTSNVDKSDLEVNNKTYDIKTALEKNHKYLIVPTDQWYHHKKDYYIGTKINYKEGLREFATEQTCKTLGNNMRNTTGFMASRIKNFNIEIEIHGFLPADSKKWERSTEKDIICPEFPCVRVKLSELQDVNNLENMLKINKK